jgi:DNA-binding XRE family transcriptional regulator
MLSFRFRAMYRSLGLNRPDAAKLLHVSERTLHNWETGHHEIPYSAYRLLRLLTRQELPGKAWTGWHITAGVLWSPEGHGFKPEDASWWSMLCRRSAQFHSLYAENSRLKRKDAQAAAALEPVSVVKLPVTLHQSLTHETFPQKNTTIDCPANVRFARVSYSLNLLKGGV